MKFRLVLLWLCVPFFLMGQDNSFSQFYSSPMYLNPALAGNVECARIGLNYRNQWPGVPQAYNTYHFTYDQYLPGISSGIGIMIYNDQQADNILSTTHVGGAYSYQAQLSDNMIMSAGLQASYIQQSLKWSELIFADQIRIDGTTANVTSETPPDNESVSYVDFSGGISFDWKEKYFGGVAVHHMGEPMNSFYENDDSQLSMKVTVHGGANFIIDPVIRKRKDILISPNILFQQQGDFHQLNVGVYTAVKPIIVGAWFRHNFENPDAAIILLGLQHENFKVGYSYDYSLSKLSGYSSGAHEISLSYNFCVYVEKRRKVRAIKCPEF